MSNSGIDNPIATCQELEQLQSVIHLLPTPALITDACGNICLGNQQAIQFLQGVATKKTIEECHLSSLFVELLRSEDFMEEILLKKELVIKKMLLRKFDKSITCVNLFARSFDEESDYILIQFTDVSPKTHTLLTEMVHSWHREMILLKPYLNKPGKEILENILRNNSVEGFCDCNSKQTSPHEVIREERMAFIQQMIPGLTKSELTFCGFLSLKMSVEEVALITGKTSNSLRVSFHRILKKTNFPHGKELLRKLESI